jgi:hypothetical protein
MVKLLVAVTSMDGPGTRHTSVLSSYIFGLSTVSFLHNSRNHQRGVESTVRLGLITLDFSYPGHVSKGRVCVLLNFSPAGHTTSLRSNHDYSARAQKRRVQPALRPRTRSSFEGGELLSSIWPEIPDLKTALQVLNSSILGEGLVSLLTDLGLRGGLEFGGSVRQDLLADCTAHSHELLFA